MELLLATKNQHKIIELQKLLGAFAVINALPPSQDLPEETGSTFEENALLKAKHVCASLKQASLADDSGLSVPLLDNKPGVYSARFAGLHASDQENRLHMIQSLKKKGVSRTPAFFTCVLALALPNGKEFTFKGECHGTLILEERGHEGFGYDSLFIPKEHDLTFAQMPAEKKGQISHRRKAILKLLKFMKEND